jgi:peptidoglycan/xylan/chitin deacetylase (PgdA/CDA1 family)
MTKLTLSFDNGPYPGASEWILDLLAERSILASFFVIADRLRDPSARQLSERARDEGHWIGNHTLTHLTPLGLDPNPEAPEREIGEAARILGDLARSELLFRPHGKGRLGPHLLSQGAALYLQSHRYTVVTWNSVPRDYEPPRGAWLERALVDVRMRDWTLLVLHDEWLDRDPLTTFLDRMLDQGMEIVQEFPPSCVAMRNGVAQAGWETLISVSPSAEAAKDL